MKIRIKHPQIIAGQYAVRGAEIDVPDRIGKDLIYHGQALEIQTSPDAAASAPPEAAEAAARPKAIRRRFRNRKTRE